VAVAEHVAGLRRRLAALAAEVTTVPHATSPRFEQARGMLMLALGLDEDDAGLCVHLLAWRSGAGPDGVAQRLVADGVQSARSSGEPSGQRPPAPTPDAPAVVRRALYFIDEHAADPVGIEDIAAAAGIGSRGLQLAFRRHVGTTPTDHLRRVRLERARRDLEAGDPVRGDTVAEIATRWGFAHHGRFAIDYRRVFGCSPSHTLRH
jgi:transcriptional regulator GlxA family with amidase domain